MLKITEKYVSAKVNHIYFLKDSPVFKFEKSKGLHKGENKVGPWHVYSNPHEPHLCMNLFLYFFIMTYLKLPNNGITLVEGINNDGSYSNLLMIIAKY